MTLSTYATEPRSPAWTHEDSPWGIPWREVIERPDWFRWFPQRPPFSRASTLRLRVLRRPPSDLPDVLFGSAPGPDSLLTSPLARLMDSGPGAAREAMAPYTPDSIGKILHQGSRDGFASLEPAQLLTALLSPAAGQHRHRMLALAAEATCRHFESRVSLYAPIYLSNECTNLCTYCGFNYAHKLPRKTLTRPELAQEAAALSRQGVREVLLLSGESPRAVGVADIAEAARILRDFFDRVAVEVFPMSSQDYRYLVTAGVTGLTLYQETYDPDRYREVHRAGRKRDLLWRLGAPERAIQAGMPRVGLGALLGLGDWRFDMLALGLHARALRERFPKVTLTLSFPRLRPAIGATESGAPVNDASLIQSMSALRLVLPDVGFVLSTREPAALRDYLAPLLITQMSAGSSTRPGGYSLLGNGAGQQFEIADRRSMHEVKAMLSRAGREAR